jgi:hypothetical protein
VTWSEDAKEVPKARKGIQKKTSFGKKADITSMQEEAGVRENIVFACSAMVAPPISSSYEVISFISPLPSSNL